MSTDRPDRILMEGVQIIFRNFEGRPSQYNPPGKRNFGVLLDNATAEAMLADDWNVKYLDPRDDDEGDDTQPQPWLPVEVAYDKGRPPKIIMLTEDGDTRTPLHESTVSELDSADIVNVDMVVNPSRWNLNGKTGIKAYLRSMYVTIEQDELDRKYAPTVEEA